MGRLAAIIFFVKEGPYYHYIARVMACRRQDDLLLINPESIENLTVMKGKSAITKYSEKATTGVIIITMNE